MPEGFFPASPGGEELVGYQLNQGADQAAEFVPVEPCTPPLRPDLLLARQQGDEGRNTRRIGGDWQHPQRPGPRPAAEIELVGPAEVVTSSSTYRHEVKLVDRGGGIGRIEYRINGAVLGRDERFAEHQPPGVHATALNTFPAATASRRPS